MRSQKLVEVFGEGSDLHQIGRLALLATVFMGLECFAVFSWVTHSLHKLWDFFAMMPVTKALQKPPNKQEIRYADVWYNLDARDAD